MFSKIQICNLALSRIFARRIQSLSDNLKEARECSAHYDMARDEVLESMDWTFAKKRKTLALLTDTYSGWTYAYDYPSDCVVAREIYNGTGNITGTSYDLENDTYVPTGDVQYEIISSTAMDKQIILTDQESAELRYTARIEDTNLFSAKFISSLAFKMASEMALSIKSDMVLSEKLLNSYLLSIGSAKEVNSNEDYVIKTEVNSLVGAR